jgi:enoyl-CoA hydratase/carnithine racemase
MRELVLTAPGKNALGTGLMTWIRERLSESRGEPLLLSGSQDAFSAGLNLKEVASLDRDGMRRFLRLLDDTVSELALHGAPVVAAINGHAIAGGCVLALACDHRVMTASESARIGLNEVALGLRFPPRTLALVRLRIAAQHRERVLLGAGLHGPRAALELGLVDEVAADPLGRGRERLAELAKHPRGAYAACKQDIRGGTLARDEAALERFEGEALDAWVSPSVKERLLAVLKR